MSMGIFGVAALVQNATDLEATISESSGRSKEKTQLRLLQTQVNLQQGGSGGWIGKRSPSSPPNNNGRRVSQVGTSLWFIPQGIQPRGL